MLNSQSEILQGVIRYYALISPKYDEIYLATASESKQQRVCLQSVLSSPGCYQHKVRNTNMDFPKSVLTLNMF